MKLRNKKTGEIGEVAGVVRFTVYEPNAPLCGNSVLGQYDTIAELCGEWEDYTPTKPLIEDEKIRKAVRAWAEANGIERVWHEYSSCWLRGNGLLIEMENEVVDLKQGNFAIAELCGEEEECGN